MMMTMETIAKKEEEEGGRSRSQEQGKEQGLLP
jgi:hypothetical protein